MALKLVRKAELGASVTTYYFEDVATANPPAMPEPDPEIVQAIEQAIEQSSREAKSAPKPPPNSAT